MFIQIKQPLLNAIQRILMDEWDPMGVRDDPDAADKYDSYAGRLYMYLALGWSAEQIAPYLAQVEMNEMEMPPRDAADLQQCAEHLVQAWKKAAP